MARRYKEGESYFIVYCVKCKKKIDVLNLYGRKLFALCPNCGATFMFDAKISLDGSVEIFKDRPYPEDFYAFKRGR